MAFLSWGRRSGSRKTSSSKFRTFIFSSLLSSKSYKIKYVFLKSFSFEGFCSMTCDTIPHDTFSKTYMWKLKCMDPRPAPRDHDFIGLGWGPFVGISDRLCREWEFLRDRCFPFPGTLCLLPTFIPICLSGLEGEPYPRSLLQVTWWGKELCLSTPMVLHIITYCCEGQFNCLVSHWTMSNISNWGTTRAQNNVYCKNKICHLGSDLSEELPYKYAKG